MSIPKLKVYRLERDYSQSSDDDLQTLVNDELVPIVPKFENPQNAEQMVGVVPRGDSRLVVEDGTWNVKKVKISDGKEGMFETEAVWCDGWVLGKGNVEMWAFVADESTADVPSYDDNAIPELEVSPQWKRIPNCFWDFSVASKTAYFDDNSFEYSDAPGQETTAVHEIQEIKFAVGRMLTRGVQASAGFWVEGGYSSSVKFKPYGEEYSEDAGIDFLCIRYKIYSELCTQGTKSIAATLSGGTVRVPFAEIYNGNRSGRMIPYKKTAGIRTTLEFASEVPVSTSAVSYEELLNYPHYYEGNYLFRKRVFPLRCVNLRPSNEESGSFEIPNVAKDWYVDGLMKPFAAEKIFLSSEKWIFKPLTDAQANVRIVSVKDGSTGEVSTSCKVTCLKSYYEPSGISPLYPSELYLFYNTYGDTLGDILDFDYNYAEAFGTASSDISEPWNISGYNIIDSAMYSNRGKLTEGRKPCDFSSARVYVKREKLFVDRTRSSMVAEDDGTLAISGSTMSFSLPSGSRMTGTALKIYDDGELIWKWEDSTPTNLSEGRFTITFNDSNSEWEFALGTAESFPEDLLVAYYESIAIGAAPAAAGSEAVIGYRIPCYQKSHEATLYVSSYPNWVQGHLNQDLDVFVGREAYSGTNVSNTQTIYGIYPSYQRDGWFAMYPEGSVQFSERQKTADYFDVLNFDDNALSSMNPDQESSGGRWGAITIGNSDAGGVLPDYFYAQSLSSVVAGTSGASIILMHKKVRYNVAHYDGIYSVFRARMSNYSVRGGWSRYALLEDDDFELGVDKKWLVRNDDYLRRYFECGRRELPEIRTAGRSPREQLGVLSEIQIEDGSIVKISTDDNRARVVMLNAGERGAVLLFNESYSFEDSNWQLVDGSENAWETAVSQPGTKRVVIQISRNESNQEMLRIGEVRSGETIPEQKNGLFEIGTYAEDAPVADMVELSGSSEWLPDREMEDAGIGIPIEMPLYDIHFEVLSYRNKVSDSSGNTIEYVSPNTGVSAVEIVIYRTEKNTI